jgi:hypothetical protein
MLVLARMIYDLIYVCVCTLPHAVLLEYMPGKPYQAGGHGQLDKPGTGHTETALKPTSQPELLLSADSSL